jgi:hypothetical protein
VLALERRQGFVAAVARVGIDHDKVLGADGEIRARCSLEPTTNDVDIG